jgi:hypothetical protein
MARHPSKLGGKDVMRSCPISHILLARIVQADSRGKRAIASTLSDAVRVDLALFCYEQDELNEIARDIAAVCDRAGLIRAGRSIGLALLAAADEPPPIRRAIERGT